MAYGTIRLCAAVKWSAHATAADFKGTHNRCGGKGAASENRAQFFEIDFPFSTLLLRRTRTYKGIMGMMKTTSPQHNFPLICSIQCLSFPSDLTRFCNLTVRLPVEALEERLGIRVNNK